jgi:cyclophilin family peptidyl-prolyl cis-trans isomerase
LKRFVSGMAAIALVTLVGCSAPVPSASSTPSSGSTPASAQSGAQVSAALSSSSALPSPSSVALGGAVSPKQFSSPPAMQIDANKQYTATIQTSDGPMTAELYAKDAPMTVNNFVFLANQGFYDNVPFHRIIKGFMVQTGDPTGTGTGGPGYRFPDEKVSRKYERGTLAMANAGPNTNGSQFFIVLQDYPLPPNYTIFGKLTDGLDTLDKLGNTPVQADARGENSKPVTPPTITGITISES